MTTLQDRLDTELRQRNQAMSNRKAQQEALYASTPRIQPSQLSFAGQLGERVNQGAGLLASGANIATNAFSDAGRGLFGLYSGAVPEIAQGGRNFAAAATGQPVPVDQSGSFVDNAKAGMEAFSNLLPSNSGSTGIASPFEAGGSEVLGIDGSTTPARKEGGDISALSIDVNGIPSRKVVTPEAMEDAADVHQRMGTDATTVTPQEAASTAGIAKASMEAQGKSFETQQEAPEGIENSVWKGFNDQFDLTTIGLTLMATAQNGNDLGVNLGLAMQAGRVAKTASKDKAIAKQEKDDRKDRQARADLAAATQQEFENTIDVGEFGIKLTAEQRAALGQPIDDENTKAQIKLRQAQAFKIYDEAKNAKGSLVPDIGATKQAQGVETLLAAGFKGKVDDPATRRVGKIFASFAESERLNGFQGDPTAKVIDHMMSQGFFRDMGWWESGNFAPANLGAQLGLN
jgi:hypothetical protein